MCFAYVIAKQIIQFQLFHYYQKSNNYKIKSQAQPYIHLSAEVNRNARSIDCLNKQNK